MFVRRWEFPKKENHRNLFSDVLGKRKNWNGRMWEDILNLKT